MLMMVTCALPMLPCQAVLVPTETIPDTPVISGHDFSKGADLDSIMSAMITSGFQATALGQAINEVNRMVRQKQQWYARDAQQWVCHSG